MGWVVYLLHRNYAGEAKNKLRHIRYLFTILVRSKIYYIPYYKVVSDPNLHDIPTLLLSVWTYRTQAIVDVRCGRLWGECPLRLDGAPIPVPVGVANSWCITGPHERNALGLFGRCWRWRWCGGCGCGSGWGLGPGFALARFLHSYVVVPVACEYVFGVLDVGGRWMVLVRMRGVQIVGYRNITLTTFTADKTHR